MQMFEEDGLPAHICNKCVVHVSKAYAFKQQCVKSDEELRKEQITLIEHQLGPTEEPIEEVIPDEDGYTYQLVEDYEDEEHIDDDDYGEEKNVQIILKVERRDDTIDAENGDAVEQYNIEMSELEEPTASMMVKEQEIVQDEVFEYEIENDGGEQATKGDSDDELDVIPKMVFRKYNKRNKKLPAPPYECAVCLKVLSNYSSYKYHMQLHSDKKVESDR